ncbi:hypothetical protein HY522_05140 [bacterium]|nr:hypothetical protein [bacterium]
MAIISGYFDFFHTFRWVTVLFLLPFFTSVSAASEFQFYGDVSFTRPDGIRRSAAVGLPDEYSAVTIRGVGAVHLPFSGGCFTLESFDHRGAELLRSPEDVWDLKEGMIEVEADDRRDGGNPAKPMDGREREALCGAGMVIRIGALKAALSGEGFARVSAEVESVLGVYSGSVIARDAANSGARLEMGPLDVLRIPHSRPPRRERLLPPPLVSPLNRWMAMPATIPIEISRELTLAGAILVECSQTRNFWSQSDRHLFQPGDPVVLTRSCAGPTDTAPVHLRIRTVSRSGLAGPVTGPFAVRLFSEAPDFLFPRTTPGDFFQLDAIHGQLEIAETGIPVRWGGVRAYSDSAGRFEIRPGLPLGIRVDDLRVDVAGFSRSQPAACVTDPDQVSRWSAAAAGSRPAQPPILYVRTPSVFFSNRSGDVRPWLDGKPLTESETAIDVFPTNRRQLRLVMASGQGSPVPNASVSENSRREFSPLRIGGKPVGADHPEIGILKDTEGPRILNVSLETAGEGAPFSVAADVLDLGVGLSLPARAVFENDAGGTMRVLLERTSELRVEGRPSPADWETFGRVRSQIWWVRVEIEDLLGNVSTFEQSVFHKRNKKFLSVGLKDIVQIWKNKL